MKYLLLPGTFFLLMAESSAQRMSGLYNRYIAEAQAHYKSDDYRRSAITYSRAFESVAGKGMINDHYNAACAWALSQNADSAFYHLNLIVGNQNYADYERIIADNDLDLLHADIRWEVFLKAILKNKARIGGKLDKALIAQLDSIYNEDQQCRVKIDDLQRKYGTESAEVAALWKIINEKDAANLKKVLAILDAHGWLGAGVVGQKGNNTLFLVIQHSNLFIQQKYLPMMREAVKKGNAGPDQLALLEDRVAIREGRKQIYGSQIRMDSATGIYYVQSLEDPDNVDVRRAKMSLRPMQEYLDYWGLKWDIAEHKKQIAEKEKAKKKQ